MFFSFWFYTSLIYAVDSAGIGKVIHIILNDFININLLIFILQMLNINKNQNFKIIYAFVL